MTHGQARENARKRRNGILQRKIEGTMIIMITAEGPGRLIRSSKVLGEKRQEKKQLDWKGEAPLPKAGGTTKASL